jgi:hypothetical protein
MRSQSVFLKPDNLLLAMLLVISVVLVSSDLLPSYYEINAYDEAKYIESGLRFLLGDIRELARGPLVAIFFAPLVAMMRNNPNWFMLVDGIGRVILYIFIWTSSIFVAKKLTEYVHPLIIAGILFVSTYPFVILWNPSDAIFTSMSALAFGQVLSFYHSRRVRDVIYASVFVGLSCASRPDGVFLLPFFVFAVFWVAGMRKNVLRLLSAALLPAGVIVGSFIIARGITTGNYSPEIGSKGYNTLYWSQRVFSNSDMAEEEAAELYGSRDQNEGSVFRAISNNLPAFIDRILENLWIVPDRLLSAYGKKLGPLLFILCGIGFYSLGNQREYKILGLFLIWPLYQVLYLGFYIREGFVLLSHFVPLTLGGIGLSYLTSVRNGSLEKVILLCGFIGLAVYSLVDSKLAFLAVAFVGFTFISLSWVSQRIIKFPALAGMTGLFLALCGGLVLRESYDFPSAWEFGITSEEKAIQFLQERFERGDVLATSLPLPAVAAKMNYIDISTLPANPEASEELSSWVEYHDVDALLITPSFMKEFPQQWDLVSMNEGELFNTIKIQDPGGFRIIQVLR